MNSINTMAESIINKLNISDEENKDSIDINNYI
jgi:hypothetical protein